MSLNKVMLIGNVGKDPEVRYLDNNNPNSEKTMVAQFTLATTERYRDRNGELRENTEWHNIVAWRNSAEVAEKYIRKGTQVFIEGKLRTRSWTDQSGNKHYTTEIIVDNLQLLGRKSDNPAAQDGSRPAQQGSYQQPAASPQPRFQAPQAARPQAPAAEPAQVVQTPSAYSPVRDPAQQPVDQRNVNDIPTDDIPQDDLPF